MGTAVDAAAVMDGAGVSLLGSIAATPVASAAADLMVGSAPAGAATSGAEGAAVVIAGGAPAGSVNRNCDVARLVVSTVATDAVSAFSLVDEPGPASLRAAPPPRTTAPHKANKATDCCGLITQPLSLGSS
jgi:hypothetical protein